jgi:hypothetical protein
MAVISTFELLVKPQLPKETISKIPPAILTQLSPLTRTIIQGYFLTLSNLTSDFIYLSLAFTVKTPDIKVEDTLALLDTNGQNIVGTVFRNPGDDTSKSRFTVPLAGNDTALFILQPDITNIALLQAANFELRGYAEISLSSGSTPKTAQILVTPEHRGTFFGSLDPKSKDTKDAKLGEVAYALPLASGKSLFELNRET